MDLRVDPDRRRSIHKLEADSAAAASDRRRNDGFRK
jgi:hypothetical protein